MTHVKLKSTTFSSSDLSMKTGLTLEGVLCTAMRGQQQNKATHLSCQAWCIFSPGAGSPWRTAGQGPQTA